MAVVLLVGHDMAPKPLAARCTRHQTRLPPTLRWYAGSVRMQARL